MKISQIGFCSRTKPVKSNTNQENTSMQLDTASKALSSAICCVNTLDVSYYHQIKSIEEDISCFDVNAFLINDASSKNLIIARQVKKCLLNIDGNNIKIPKMDIHLDNWDEYFDDNKCAAITDVIVDGDDIEIEQSYNTPAYKYLANTDDLYRLRGLKDDTSFSLDFYHEFAHAYQGYFDHDNYSKLLKESFGEDARKEISKNISVYACSNKAEFVAEYFAYKMIGKNFQSDYLDFLYQECNGPELNGLMH